MTLEPEMHAFIERTEALMPSDAAGLDWQEIRARYDAMCRAFTPARPDGLEVHDLRLGVPGRTDVPARLYAPARGDPDALILYLHGGGFVLGGLDSHDLVTARLAHDVPAKVIAVDYRLAPENRAPAAFDDSLTALLALRACPHAVGARAPQIVVSGDSAGATLALAVAIADRMAGDQDLVGQILIYGSFGAGPDLPSYREEADAPLLKASDVGVYQHYYLGPDKTADWRSQPILGRLAGLPPTLLLPVEHDPLRDESYALRDALTDAGVSARLHLGEGLVHGCLRALTTSPNTQKMLNRATTSARAMLGLNGANCHARKARGSAADLG